MSDSTARAARKWSAAINRLNAWKKRRESTLRENRQRALAALPEAAPHLVDWRSGVAQAGKVRDNAIAAAAGEERQALMKALNARSAATAKAEARYRSGEETAYEGKLDAEARAETAFEKAVDQARSRYGVSEQYLKARRKAEQVRDEALASARADYESAKKALHRVRHKAVQEGQKGEYTATLAAWSAREKSVARAEATHRTTVAALDKKLRDALARVPGAKEIRREFAAKSKKLQAEYGRKEQRIFRQLRDAIRG